MPELSPSFEDAWERFQTCHELRPASETLEWEWSHGRAQFLTCLVRIEDRTVRAYAQRVIDRLDGIPGVAPFPEEYWHITVKQIGFQVIRRVRQDDVLRQDVGRLTREARRILSSAQAYDARIGPPGAFPDVVFLEVEDGGNTRELNVALGEQIRDVARYPSDGATFLPHISIARFTSDEGLGQLKAALGELRMEDPGPALQIHRVDFVKAWLSEEVPDLETLAACPLATPTA